MQLMARYPDGYFQLAIVDPPYGIGYSDLVGKKKESDGWKKGSQVNGMQIRLLGSIFQSYSGFQKIKSFGVETTLT